MWVQNIPGSLSRDRRDGWSGGLLFSPASCYPNPAAYVTDSAGAILHTWSHPACQPSPQDDPPGYLRGWNHVEADASGNLFAIVPLRSLLKLTPASELEWCCDVAAHHDLAIDDTGVVYVLTEAPRLVTAGGRGYVVLDNLVTIVTPGGAVKAEVSLYDLLRTDPWLRSLIDAATERRRAELLRLDWPAGADVPDAVVTETRSILRTATYQGERRRALQRLRDLPGSPCDVLHTNTLELLAAHPDGLWKRGDLLICMRELNMIAVVDLDETRVTWCWGPGELSGPHQPSVLPDGRILVFDNGQDRQRTRLIMMDPGRREVVWSWSAQPPESFFCPLAGGCERLSSGNLLVTNSTGGGGFELTPDGQVVWQLSLPVEVFGAQRGRVSIYRLAAVPPEVVARLSAAAGRPQGTA